MKSACVMRRPRSRPAYVIVDRRRNNPCAAKNRDDYILKITGPVRVSSEESGMSVTSILQTAAVTTSWKKHLLTAV